jgi:hypothetical protein
MKKMHILLLGALPILLLLVSCGQDTPTSVSSLNVQPELTLAKITNARGTIVSINPAEKHGTIERTDDGSNNLYQFSIPRDVQQGSSLAEGDIVVFTIDPENSRHATNVIEPCIPPNCSGR